MFDFRSHAVHAATVLSLVALASGIFVGESPKITLAPTGFSTPTLNRDPGSLSTSNGIAEPAGDTFSLDQSHFEESEGNDTGLGPIYNATSCASCHQNPVTGGNSQMTELRVGHVDGVGNFTNPTIWINDGHTAIVGRSLVNDRATCAQAQERVPPRENIRSLRITPSILGDGFIEAVDDNTLIELSHRENVLSHGEITGEYILVPILESPGSNRIGRFGWKDQEASLLSFGGDAYLNEMGVTNRLDPVDLTSVCKSTSDPEDSVDDIGMADIDHFAQFIRGTKAPPTDAVLFSSSDAQVGRVLFDTIACNLCHTPALVTSSPGTILNGGTYVVADAIGNKEFHPYSDFLLHDVGTGDGIVQNGPQDTAQKMRTAPLWGLRTRDRYMHDGRALTLTDTIRQHAGEASTVIRRYQGLTTRQKSQLLLFLKSL